MMVKSGLEKCFLKFQEQLQRYLLTCQANSAGIFALGSSKSEGVRGISKYIFFFSFSPSFFKPKMVISRIILAGVDNNYVLQNAFRVTCHVYIPILLSKKCALSHTHVN